MSRTRVIQESRAYDNRYDPVYTTSAQESNLYHDRRVAPVQAPIHPTDETSFVSVSTLDLIL